MSQYHLERCSSMEEYKEKKRIYEQALQEADALRAEGLVVNIEIDYPLPPEGYGDAIIVARGIQVE